MTRALTTAGILLLAANAAQAATWCHPVDNTARILASHNPNDLHPEWAGESYIGTSWALAPGQRVRTNVGEFIVGDLYSPRGALVTKGVYVIAREWKCS